MTKYISDTPICLEDSTFGGAKELTPVFPSLSKRGVHPEGLTLKGIKGGELPVPSGAYFSFSGAKS
jgi:hypothetical protein